MVERKFKIVEAMFNDYLAEFWGMTKDTTINEENKPSNYGGSSLMYVGFNDSNDEEQKCIFEITMPKDEDLEGYDSIHRVYLDLYVASETHNDVVDVDLALISIDDIWDEGTLTGSPGWCNWDEAQPGVAWKAGAGAVKSNCNEGGDGMSSEETALDVVRTRVQASLVGTWLRFDLTDQIDLNNKKTFVIVGIESKSTTGNDETYEIFFNTRESTFSSNRPRLFVQYRDYPPEAFESAEDDLLVEPNQDNPEQPKLKWGQVNDGAFTSYKIFRSTSPIYSLSSFGEAITAVSTVLKTFTIAGNFTSRILPGTLIYVDGGTNEGAYTVSSCSFTGGNTVVTVEENITSAVVGGYIIVPTAIITNPTTNEWIDTSSLTDGQDYYYIVVAEDSKNSCSEATWSSNAKFHKPDVISNSLDLSGNRDVGTLVTLTVSGDVPIKRLFVDWKDGTQSWYDFEVAGTTKAVSHIYLSHSSGALTPEVRIEDTNIPSEGDEPLCGFWSGLTSATNSITLDDLLPLAKLRTNVQKAVPFSYVTLDASLSQPASSDATITKYEFKQHAGDSWHDNLADPIYQFQLSGHPWNGTITSVSDGAGDVIRFNLGVSANPGLSIGDTIIVDGADEYSGIHTVVGFGLGYIDVEHRFWGTRTGAWFNLTTQTAELRVTTSTSETNTTTLDYELGHEVPFDLNLSPDTSLTEMPHMLGYNKEIVTPIGSEGYDVEYNMSRPAERVEILGETSSPHIEWDMAKLRQAQADNRVVKFSIPNEYETKIIEYTGRIVGDITISTIMENKSRFSLTVLVYTRVETYLPSKGGVVTTISNNNGECRVYTDFEDIKLGEEIRLMNMTNKEYNGLYLVTDVNYPYNFTLNATYLTPGETGEWRKAVYTEGER